MTGCLLDTIDARAEGALTAMPIPNYHTLMLLVLRAGASGEIRTRDCDERLAQEPGAPPRQRSRL